MLKGINLEVRLEDCNGDFERMIRRFLKKFKKNKLLDEFRKKDYYEKPSDIKREKKKRRKEVLRKLREKTKKEN